MESRPWMAELPELVVWLISEYLSYNDRLSLRMTCKRLKEAIDLRTSRSLHLFMTSHPYQLELLHTGEQISYANTYHVSGLDMFKAAAFKHQFKGLLKLTIYDDWQPFIDSKSVNLNDLNYLRELVHLELRGIRLEGQRLNLKNLKILKIQMVFLDNIKEKLTKFKLECPQLSALDLGGYQPRLSEQTAMSVRHLYIYNDEMNENYLLNLYAKLKTLSSICFVNADYILNRLVRTKIGDRECLPSLEKIQWKVALLKREIFNNLRDLKSSDETKYIEILINDKVIGVDELTDILDLFRRRIFDNRFVRSISPYTVWGLAKNPNLHCLLPSFNHLIIETPRSVDLTKQLIGEFKNFESLDIGGEIDLDEEFFESIKICRKISYLKIECSHLKQEHLDRIPNYLPNLLMLALEDSFSEGSFNLNFIAKLKHLHNALFDFNLKEETMSFLLQNCDHNPDFHLELRGKQNIWIFREPVKIIRGSKWNYENLSNKSITFNSIEDAIKYYYQHDLFNTRYINLVNLECCLI